jgi:putative salt-induced outer membrane protein YdiY
MMRRVLVSAICLSALSGVASALRAQDAAAPAATPAVAPAPPVKWSDTAELGYVATSGNSESSTIGFKNALAREEGKSRFEIKLGGIRVSTTDITLTAVGTPTDFTREKDTQTRTTAENYYLNGRYDRKITDRFFWFAGVGWDRNVPSGIADRYMALGGVGNIWIDAERRKWRTDYSVTGTKETDVVEAPDFNSTFAGVQVSSSFKQKFGQHDIGLFVNDTIVDENLSDTTDWRVNMTNSVALNMTSHLALKVSLQWLYDHQPAFKSVPLFDAAGNPVLDPAPPNSQVQVLVPADDLDTIFTTALVIKY